jgi:hypothetical protein
MTKRLPAFNVTSKTTALLLFQLLFVFCAKAQTTYTWTNAAGNNDWLVGANWSPNRSIPAATDILLFNSGTTVSPKFTSINEAIGKLVVSNNTTVTFTPPVIETGIIRTLTINGLAGDDLYVEAGSTIQTGLAPAGVRDSISVFLATGATAKINGTILLQRSRVTLDASAAGAIIFESGSLCSAGAIIGATNVFNASGTPNVVVFKNGASFHHAADNSLPFGLVAPLSKVVFEPNSNYTMGNKASFAPTDFSGRTFGNLTLGISASFSATTFTGNLPLRINNLIIPSGPFAAVTFNLTGGIFISGNIEANRDITFNPPTTGEIVFDGVAQQNIRQALGAFSGLVSFGTNANVKINNPAGLLIDNSTTSSPNYNGNITINGVLNLTSGAITVPDPAVLTLSATAAVINAGANSYVDGFVKKVGNTAFTFPVGRTNTGYAPIAINAPSTVTDAFTVSYKRSSAQLISTNYALGLDHVSEADYWTLERSAGTSNLSTITAYWTPQTSNNGSTAYIDNPAAVRLARYTSTPSPLWDSYGGIVNAGSTISNGSVTWFGSFSNLGIFSLSSVNASNPLKNLAGPLPVSINYLQGAKQAGNNNLNWKVTCTNISGVTMELQRSTSRTGTFKNINTVTATALRCLQPFDYIDASPAVGTNYYRIKTIDDNGKITFSNTIAIVNNTDGLDVSNIYPSVVSTTANVNVSTAQRTKLTIVTINADGKVMQQQQFAAIAGNNQIPLTATQLPAGLYFVKIYTDKGETKTLKFIKQ